MPLAVLRTRIWRPSRRTTSLPAAASSLSDTTSIHAMASLLVTGILIDWADAIDATSRPGEHVLVADDPRCAAEHAAEDLELGPAESLADRGGGADRAVILDEEKILAVLVPFGHVALARPERGEALDAFRHAAGTRQGAGIAVPGLRLARGDDLLQRRLAENAAHRGNELYGQLGMCVGKARIADIGQPPCLPGPPYAVRGALDGDEPLLGELQQ